MQGGHTENTVGFCLPRRREPESPEPNCKVDSPNHFSDNFPHRQNLLCSESTGGTMKQAVIYTRVSSREQQQ